MARRTTTSVVPLTGGGFYIPPTPPPAPARRSGGGGVGTLLVIGGLAYLGWSLTHPGEVVGLGASSASMNAATLAPTQPAARTAAGQAANPASAK